MKLWHKIVLSILILLGISGYIFYQALAKVVGEAVAEVMEDAPKLIKLNPDCSFNLVLEKESTKEQILLQSKNYDSNNYKIGFDGQFYYLLSTQQQIAAKEMKLDSEENVIVFSKYGAEKMKQISHDYLGKQLALVCKDKVLNTAIIKVILKDPKIQIDLSNEDDYEYLISRHFISKIESKI